MESFDFDDLLAQGRQIGSLFASVYKDVTGEDLDVESAIKHYPVLAVGVAAAAGAAAGWWFGRRGQKELPPPAVSEIPPPTGANPMDSIGDVLPNTVEKVRKALPEVVVPDEVKAAAKNFFESVLEPRIQENIDGLASTVDARLSTFLARFGTKPEANEDVHLEDPEST